MKDNKKKMMIVALLALVVVGVGAFQFMGGSNSAPVTSEKKKTPTPTASPTAEPPKNPLVATALPERDPFETPKDLMPTPTPTPQPTPNPQSTHEGRPVRNTEHIPPMPIGGTLPDAMGNGGSMGGPIGPGGKGPIAVEPTAPAYQLVGVMVGARPVAVFSDSQGNQRLVQLGGSVDGDTKVTGIEKGKVTLRFHNKTIRLSLGGNPNAK